MNLSKKKFLVGVLALLGVIYFIVFIPANLTGAQNENMISVFQHDEFAQYPHVIRMLTPGDTPYQTLRNFFVYLHYFYGYPFYFISAMSILPLKIILGSQWFQNTAVIMAVLRQLINVLPMLLSAYILVWLQTRFDSWIKSVSLWILLVTFPGVVLNNMWWHPDSLLVLFSVLTIYLLAKDDLRFGKYFYLSAATCGLAIGVKILGVLFILTYAVYILYGVVSHQISFKKALLKSLQYLGLLALVLVITNPLLLLPIERSEIISIFKQNLRENTVGFWVVGNSEISIAQKMFEMFTNNFASILLLLASVAALLYGIIKGINRVLNMVIFTWVLAYLGYFLMFASTMRIHYLIPAAVPLLSALSIFIPDAKVFKSKGHLIKKVALGLLIIGIWIQIGINLGAGYPAIQEVQNRESTSKSIQLFSIAENEILSKLDLDRKIRIYRDWRAYVEENENYYVEFNWDLATYDVIQNIYPDVIFLERDNILYFSDAAKIENAVNPSRMSEMVLFYSDAELDQISGYRLVLRTDFGSVYLKEELFNDYLSPSDE